MLIQTKGRARQKTFTLAKKAGIEVKAVVFTHKETEAAVGYKLSPRICSKKDNCFGRAFQSAKIIWLQLPVSLDTIAHELAHLKTTTSHSQQSFTNLSVGIRRGLAHKKPQYYTVSVTTEYKVFEQTPALAKKNYHRGSMIGVKTITARQMK